jgi:outer membrane protein TolC
MNSVASRLATLIKLPDSKLAETHFPCLVMIVSITWTHFRHLPRSVIAASLALGVAGCATYSPAPLPDWIDLAERFPLQAAQPLDMNAVAAFAILNNPDLKAARLKARVADAQSFAAGILPNPQLTSELVVPTNQGPAGGNGYGFGLSYDIQALIIQPARVAAANAARDQARLGLFWQEWQTVAQARTLYVQGVIAAEKHALYAAAEEAYATRSERSRRAVQTGDLTFDQAGTDLAALLDARSQLRTAQRTATQTDYLLRTLLGLAKNVDMTLQPLMLPEIPNSSAVETALVKVAQLRPDLRALRAGYESQEQTLRQAVLMQFPSLSLGLTRLTDTAGDRSSFDRVIHAVSIGATLNLPLFDHNQGNIAIQSVTREQLLAEYQARLDQTTGDAWRIWSEMQELTAGIQDIQAQLPELQMAAENAERAYLAGDLPALSYVTLQSAVLNRQSELADLRQSLWNDAIALSSVIGTQIEPVVAMKEITP